MSSTPAVITPVVAQGAAAQAVAAAPAVATAPAAAPVVAAAPVPVVPFQSASLYVGDLHNEVTESILFELFNKVGPVASIRVCRDSVSRRSLGYAYVNFHDVRDAERSLDTMNFTDIKTRPCRIMWSQRDPSLRKSGVGNVFVRNLAPSVDNKGLYDTFSVFGNILSCKVATDENSVSKGYGYVHFETSDAAQDAISKFDGTLIDDVAVHVGIFVRRQERAGQADWTNLYVKQFPTTWDEAKLKETFEVFGPVANVSISKESPEGPSRGFGFVSFAEHASAVKALEGMANKVLEEGQEPLYVNRAEKKTERSRNIKNKLDALNQERVSKYQGMNLYVKNIADTMTDDSFRETFAPFGTITSARIMREVSDAKTSKGFGFICYSSPEEATAAVSDMNGKVVNGKPLVVTLHQRKEHRRQHLAATYAPQGGMRYQGNGMNMPPFMGMYMPQQPGYGQGPRGAPGPFPYGGPNQMGGRGPGGPGMQRGMPPGAGRPGFYPGQAPPFMQQGGMQGPAGPGKFQQGGMRPGQPGGFQPGPGGMQGGPQGVRMGGAARGPQQGGVMPGQMGPGGPMGPGVRGPMPGGPMGANRGPMGAYPGQMQQQQQQQGLNRAGPNNMVKFNNQARNNGQMMPMMPGQMQQGMPPQMMQQQAAAANPPSKLDFSDAALASADPLTQKNMIGEHLYPLIYQHQPEQAGKITGMLLEMDNGELLNLIESPDALMSKIEEALHVLRNHKPTAEE